MLGHRHLRLTAVIISIFMAAFLGNIAFAAPYAALVMDTRTGQVLHSRNADTKLHPASLTKMMTLYVVFEAIERGEISLEQKVRISKNAAAEPPSKLGLRSGERIKLRYLIRGAAVKSANDAATALAEAISGSEAAFAKRMTATARKLGMSKTTFKNAHGLTRSGHLSTARDMTLLGRRLFYDYPQYYNLFSRKTTDAGIKQIQNTNRKLLGDYRGADGIKTGYTNAAGFNLVASAERGNKRVIATVFGGKTSSRRNARVAQLLDMGFGRVDTRLVEVKPNKVAPSINNEVIRAVADSGAVRKSLIPKMRAVFAPVLVAAVDQSEVERAVLQAVIDAEKPQPQKVVEVVAAIPKPEAQKMTKSVIKVQKPIPLQTTRPLMRSAEIVAVAYVTPEPVSDEPRIVSRKSTSGRAWSVQVGAYDSKFEAEKALLKTALSNLGPLVSAERRIAPATVNGTRLYRARFVGLSQADANKTCSRLRARSQTCVSVSPGS